MKKFIFLTICLIVLCISAHSQLVLLNYDQNLCVGGSNNTELREINDVVGDTLDIRNISTSKSQNITKILNLSSQLTNDTMIIVNQPILDSIRKNGNELGLTNGCVVYSIDLNQLPDAFLETYKYYGSTTAKPIDRVNAPFNFGGTTTENSNTLSNITNAVGGLDVTTIADGLAKFFVKRANEELSIHFFKKLHETLDSQPDLESLFP